MTTECLGSKGEPQEESESQCSEGSSEPGLDFWDTARHYLRENYSMTEEGIEAAVAGMKQDEQRDQTSREEADRNWAEFYWGMDQDDEEQLARKYPEIMEARKAMTKEEFMGWYFVWMEEKRTNLKMQTRESTEFSSSELNAAADWEQTSQKEINSEAQYRKLKFIENEIGIIRNRFERWVWSTGRGTRISPECLMQVSEELSDLYKLGKDAHKRREMYRRFEMRITQLSLVDALASRYIGIEKFVRAFMAIEEGLQIDPEFNWDADDFWDRYVEGIEY